MPMTKEEKAVTKAVLFQLRDIFIARGKDAYPCEEIAQLLDSVEGENRAAAEHTLQSLRDTVLHSGMTAYPREIIVDILEGECMILDMSDERLAEISEMLRKTEEEYKNGNLKITGTMDDLFLNWDEFIAGRDKA